MLRAWPTTTIRVGCALVAVGCSLAACGGIAGGEGPEARDPAADPAADSSNVSRLIVTANGEDLVRRGLTSKDGWVVTFDHVFVTMADVTAYRTDPPFDASSGGEPGGEAVSISGPVTIDLAAGGADADPVTFGVVTGAPSGHYNAMEWRLEPAQEVDARGAALQLSGTATKSGHTIRFTLSDNTTYTYRCGEYVGEGRKGILTEGGSAHVEATFHVDHIFGSADAAANDLLNVGALGFSPLAALAVDDVLEVSVDELSKLLGAADHAKLVAALGTLGHVGEGHCYEANHGYTGHRD